MLDGLRRGDRRAELRQEFQRLSRPRRLAVRQDRLGRDDQRGAWRMSSSARARCGRCRPIMARRPSASSSTMPELRARLAGRARRDARPDQLASAQRIAAADPRLAYIGGQFGMFSMLPLTPGAGAASCARTTRSTWPTAAASTSSAWRRPDRPLYRRRGRGAGRLTMADRDPGRVSADVDWREVARLVLTSREMDRLEEQELVPGQEGPLPVLGARPRHGAGAARPAAQGRRRGLRLLPLAAAAAGARRAAGRCARLRNGPRRRLFRRPRYRRRVQLPQSGRRARAADVRRGRRAIYAGGRLGAGDRLQDEGPEAKGRTTRSRWCSAATRAAPPADFGQR